jgi:hypothetical protein
MLETYQGILEGDRIKWVGDAPPRPLGQARVRVHVTLLDPVPTDEEEVIRGRRRAEALERLAARGGVASVPDPLAWEREMREDRPLPGRDE